MPGTTKKMHYEVPDPEGDTPKKYIHSARQKD